MHPHVETRFSSGSWFLLVHAAVCCAVRCVCFLGDGRAVNVVLTCTVVLVVVFCLVSPNKVRSQLYLDAFFYALELILV